MAEIVLVFIAIGLAAGFAGSEFSGPQWLGGLLGAFAGVGYGLGATLNEKFCQDLPITEFLAKNAVPGFIVNLILTLTTEIPLYPTIPWQGWVI